MNQNNVQTIKSIITALAIGCAGFFCFALLLQPFFTGSIELSQQLSFGGVKIQLYGLIIALAAASGYWLALRRREKFGIDRDDADTLILYLVIAGFVGSRLYHVLSEFQLYVQNPLQAFAIWNGGLSIFGAGIGGATAVLLYQKYHQQYSVYRLLDWLIPSVVLGQIIGRFGNFFNYELYGTPANVIWKMFVPVQFRRPPYEMSQFFHPLFLYEAAGSAVILVLLLRLRLKTGYLFLLWLFLYTVMRFFLENYLRVGSVLQGGIRVNAWISLAFTALAVILTHRLWKTYNKTVYEESSTPNN